MKPRDQTDSSTTGLDLPLQQQLLAAIASERPDPPRSAQLAARIQARVEESKRRHAGLVVHRREDGQWKQASPGLRYKTLWAGAEGASALIALSPGAVLPAHRHGHVEEGMVLEGRLQLGQLDLGVGDFHVSLKGSRHDRIHSRQGALAFLRGTSLGSSGAMLGELLGGLLPHSGGEPVSISLAAGSWRQKVPGAEEKLLHSEGKFQSRLLRLQPGADLPWAAPATLEECVLIEGEAFLGDTLLRKCDYQRATSATRYGHISSDLGALLYLRGDGAGVE